MLQDIMFECVLFFNFLWKYSKHQSNSNSKKYSHLKNMHVTALVIR